MCLCGINYWAVIVSGLIAYGMGAIWYTVLFGKLWKKEVGMTSDSVSKSVMMKTMIGSLLLMLFMCFGLAIFIQGHKDTQIDALTGLYIGLATGVFFNAASMGINYLYQLKSFKLWLIDSLYQILYLGIAGLILGVWK